MLQKIAVRVALIVSLNRPDTRNFLRPEVELETIAIRHNPFIQIVNHVQIAIRCLYNSLGTATSALGRSLNEEFTRMSSEIKIENVRFRINQVVLHIFIFLPLCGRRYLCYVIISRSLGRIGIPEISHRRTSEVIPSLNASRNASSGIQTPTHAYPAGFLGYLHTRSVVTQ